MTIYLYNLLTDPRTVDKSGTGMLSPASMPNTGYDIITGMSGTLRDRCDMIDPVISLAIDKSEVTNFNYIYVKDWKRYYFVNRIVIETTGLLTIYCHVDVLFSYKDGIRALSAYVARTESNAKPFLADPKRPLSQNETYTVLTPSSGTGVFNPTSNTSSKLSFVILLANYPGIGGTVTYTNDDPNRIFPGAGYSAGGLSTKNYAMTRDQVELFFQDFYNTNWSSILNSLLGNSADGVTDLISYPFDIPSGVITTDTNPQAVSMFNHAMTAQGSKLRCNPYVTFSFGSFTQTSNDYIHREPYSKARMYLPYVGEIDIPMLALNDGITVKYQVNLLDGDAVVSVTNDVTGVYVYTATAHIGIHVPVSKTNNVEQARNNLLAMVQAGSAFAQNPVNGLASLGNALVKIGLNTEHINAGKPASELSRMLRYDPYILLTETEDLTPVNYGKFVGYPYEDIDTLSSFSGFTVVGEVFGHMSFAQENEQNEIFNLLKSGVIL